MKNIPGGRSVSRELIWVPSSLISSQSRLSSIQLTGELHSVFPSSYSSITRVHSLISDNGPKAVTKLVNIQSFKLHHVSAGLYRKLQPSWFSCIYFETYFRSDCQMWSPVCIAQNKYEGYDKFLIQSNILYLYSYWAKLEKKRCGLSPSVIELYRPSDCR
jgi:hypothetical protein